MSRTKEFDVDVALQAALDLFWRQGYEATSVNDLVEHLGIGRASMYATFGNKHDLYLRALDRYVQSTDADIMKSLSQPGPVLPAVRELVLGYVSSIAADEQQRGCLVVNAATELLPADVSVAHRVGRSWDTLEVSLTLALSRAKAQGELASDLDPRALARFLLAVLQGLRVLSKGPSPLERLRDAANQALRVLASA